LPAAKRIVDRLNAKQQGKHLRWRELLAVAHSPRAAQVGVLVNKERTPEQNWLTDSQISFALRLVAVRLNMDTISRDQYINERSQMKVEGIPVETLRLPTAAQILRAMKRKLRQQRRTFPLRVKIRATDPASGSSVKFLDY
jgi:hypothetical protein